MPITPPLENDHVIAHLQAKTVPINLIWSESAQWLWSSSIRKIPRALIMPMGMPIMPPWANGHAVAHLQATAVPMNLIWNESAQWLLSFSVRKIPGAIIMPWACHYAPMGKSPCRCIPTGQNSSNELDLEWICPVVVEFWCRQNSRSPYHAHGHAHYAPMGKWPWRCTPTSLGGSNELDLEWISPVAAEF